MLKRASALREIEQLTKAFDADVDLKLMTLIIAMIIWNLKIHQTIKINLMMGLTLITQLNVLVTNNNHQHNIIMKIKLQRLVLFGLNCMTVMKQ